MNRVSSTMLVSLIICSSITASDTNLVSFTIGDRNLRSLTHLVPSAERTALYGYRNPAALSYSRQATALTAMELAQEGGIGLRSAALFSASNQTGAGLYYNSPGGPSATTAYIARAAGTRSFSSGFGLRYTWSARDSIPAGLTTTVGFLARPGNFYSLETSGGVTIGDGALHGLALFRLRPFGNEWLTLSGSYAAARLDDITDDQWNAAVSVEPLSGLRLMALFDEREEVSLGLHWNFGYSGISGIRNRIGGTQATTIAIRGGSYARTFLRESSGEGREYLKLDLHKPLRYRRYLLLDESQSLLRQLSAIDAASRDPAIGAIAVYGSGMSMPQEFAWELRRALGRFQSSGKKVVFFIDRGGMTPYFLASVADHIVMDPQGSLLLPGFVAGRTYYRRTLEKLGLSFDEWRFYKYKSAFENYSRTGFSDGAREQRKALVSGIYQLVQSEICSSRGFSFTYFDSLVDNRGYFRASDALQAELVDTIGRWETVLGVLESLQGSREGKRSPEAVLERDIPAHEHWGEPPKVAVMYAEGICAMDQGINARQLEEILDKVRTKSEYKALVFRVDSPGGDPMAADVVAQALRRCAQNKPVVVSQGSTAASGGYWISMYGDTIMAAPNTITGSIGVIGGWLYDSGLSDTLGITTDHVQEGEHADYRFGPSLPVIGTMLPGRNLSTEEKQVVEESIRSMYQDFITKVAQARDRDTAYIDSISQGRVWLGDTARALGLTDCIGNLHDAIITAADRAGISRRYYEVTEVQDQPLLPIQEYLPWYARRWQEDNDKEGSSYRFLLEHSGQPLMLLPIDLWE